MWLFIIGSRFPSEWLDGGAPDTPDAILEGSATDRNVFLVLLLAGLAIIVWRRASLRLYCRDNPWIALFFFYSAVSILWSDFPLTAFKRWHKVIGHVVMAMVVMTEQDPRSAFASLFRRAGYVVIAVSIVLIKYFDYVGRGYDRWTNKVISVGITTNKNALGNLCLVFGLFFLAAVLRRASRETSDKHQWFIDILFLGMVLWLLQLANSATSLLCLIVGATVTVLVQFKPVSRHFTRVLVGVVVVLTIAQVSFNARDAVIIGLGRDTTLTGRTELWDILQKIPVNPLIGVGFESFWLGSRLDNLWQIYWWKPNQAHDGYLETYLNLGLIGVSLQLMMMIACYRLARARILAGDQSRAGDFDVLIGQFSLAFLVSLALYNLTEATFKALHLSFFVFVLVSTRYTGAVVSPPAQLRSRTIQPRWARVRNAVATRAYDGSRRRGPADGGLRS